MRQGKNRTEPKIACQYNNKGKARKVPIHSPNCSRMAKEMGIEVEETVNAHH